MHPLRGYLYIATATLCWGIAAALGKAIFTGRLFPSVAARPIDPLVLSQTRVSFAFLVLAPALWFAHRWRRPLRAAMRMRARHIVRALLIGIAGIATSNFFYYVAIEKTTVATAIILQYLAPIWVLLYMVARHLQRATLHRVLGVALAVVGSALAIGAVGGGLKFNSAGVLAGLAASAGFAIYNVAGSALLERFDRWRVFMDAMLGATLFWAVVDPPWRLVAARYSQAQWIFLLAFSVGSVLIPYSFYFSGLRHLDATRAIVTACLEPVFAIAVAAIYPGERIGMVQIVGVALVLFATIIVQVKTGASRSRQSAA
jgi:drug/metabolite transporter (DMT)-like permease